MRLWGKAMLHVYFDPKVWLGGEKTLGSLRYALFRNPIVQDLGLTWDQVDARELSYDIDGDASEWILKYYPCVLPRLRWCIRRDLGVVVVVLDRSLISAETENQILRDIFIYI